MPHLLRASKSPPLNSSSSHSNISSYSLIIQGLVRARLNPLGRKCQIPLQGRRHERATKEAQDQSASKTLLIQNGIEGRADDIKSRVDKYGSNEPILKDPLTLYEIIMENFEDPTMRILVAAAIVSLLLGVITEGFAKGWIEGASILIAVVIVVGVGSFNNYVKEQQFQKLNQQVAQKDVAVMRNGKREVISAYDLVVGDIAIIQTGEVLTVDGIVI